MKTYKHLYPALTHYANLHGAYRKARRGKRLRRDVAAFEFNADWELLTLQEELLSGDYHPGPYRHFDIYETKPRRISAAPFRDRVIHHALCNVLDPIWEPRFIHDSYACRKGKGSHAALDRCTHFARRHRYVLQANIVQFFPSIDLEILYEILARKVVCPQTRTLIRKILDSGKGIHDEAYRMQWFPGDDLLALTRHRGLPIGNQTSQFWANVYLHELDEFVKRELRCGAYLRYCDDFLLFADDKPTLHRWQAALEEKLVDLRLKIHPHKTTIQPVSTGIPFLGFRAFPDHRRLSRDNALRFKRRWRGLCLAFGAGRVDRQTLETRLKSWLAHASHGDTWQLRRGILRTPLVLPTRSTASARMVDCH